MSDSRKRGFWVYLVECRGGALYVGQTADLARRIEEHNGAGRGARFTSGRRPVRLRAAWRVATRGAALRVEAFIRRGGRARKTLLIEEPAVLGGLVRRAGIARAAIAANDVRVRRPAAKAPRGPDSPVKSVRL